MPLKSILNVWDGKKTSRAAFTHALSIANDSDGHLHVLCPAYVTILTGAAYPFASFPPAINPREQEQVESRAEARAKEVQDMLAGAQVSYSIETAILNRDELAGLMNHAARYSDIVVLPKPYGDDRNETDEHVAEGALFSNQCPVLIVPPNADPSEPTKALIAWDGSEQSLRATKRALPLLSAAQTVHVVIIGKDHAAAQNEEFARDIGIFLSRHQIRVDIKILPDNGGQLSEMILSHAQTLGANLIVMGGYGHSPLREFLFGGATRDMLKQSDIPILMAH